MTVRPHKKKRPVKVTAKSLENAGIYYLQRFASSTHNFRRVMMRRIERAVRYQGMDIKAGINEGASLVDDLVLRFTEKGLLNDRAYALALAGDLHRRGLSTRAIRAKLLQKGLNAETIEAALASLKKEAPQPDLAALLVLARKRRLGPYRKDSIRANMRQKDLALLARAGFDYHLATKVIDAENINELEELASSI